MAQGTEFLFIYGSLMMAFGGPIAARLAGESRVIGPATVGGRLYDFGAYPGAVVSEAVAQRIHGLVVKLSHPARALRWLDAYEGASEADPEPQAFQRVIAPARLNSGRRLDAWVYHYRGALAKARQIRNGRYAPRKLLIRLPA